MSGWSRGGGRAVHGGADGFLFKPPNKARYPTPLRQSRIRGCPTGFDLFGAGERHKLGRCDEVAGRLD